MNGTAVVVALSMIMLGPLILVMIALLQGGQPVSGAYIDVQPAASAAASCVYRRHTPRRLIHRGGRPVGHPAWGPR